MAILRHVDAEPAERAAYLKQANAMRRAANGERLQDEPQPADNAETAVIESDDAELADGEAGDLSPARYAELGAAEQFVLTVSEKGFGKRTSAYEYRVSGRGGKGIIAMAVNERNGRLVASFPVDDTDHIMLVTDGGQLIRCPVEGVSITGRSTQGVTIFRTGADERVVSVELINDEGNGNGGSDPEGNGLSGSASS